MPTYTNNMNLYKWDASDEKQTTIQEIANNADKLDSKLNEIGSASDLETDAKDNLVEGINENRGNLSIHKTASVLDHPDLSVTREKIALGAIGPDQLDPSLLTEPTTDIGIQGKFDSIDEQLADIATNVKAKGAKGDGVTDDTSAIQSAIDFANSNGGGIVLFPYGTYIIDPNIGIKIYSNIRLLGEQATLKAKGGSVNNNVNMIVTNGWINGAYSSSIPFIENVIIEGITIDGNDANTTYPLTNFSATSQYTIQLVGGDSGVTGNVIISGGLIDDSATSETIALNGTNTVNGSVHFNTIRSITFPSGTSGKTVTVNGVDISTSAVTNIYTATLQSSSSVVQNPTVTGIQAYKVQNFVVRDCTIQNLPGRIGGGYGFISSYSNQVTLDNVTIDHTDRSNIYGWETQNLTIKNSNLSYSYFRDAATLGSAVPVSYQGTTYVIENCTLSNNSTTGTHIIRNTGTISGTIRDSIINGNPNYEAIYLLTQNNAVISVINNQINGASYGISAANGATGQTFYIDKNTIQNCNSGIRINQQMESVTITNNKIKGTITCPLYVSSSVHAIVTNNEIDGGNAHIGLFADTSFVFSHNKIRNLTDSSYAVLVGSSGSAIAIPIIIGNTSQKNTQNDIRVVTDAKAVGNNANINSSTVHNSFLNTHAIIYQSSAPTTGTWTQGDVCYHTAPVASGNVGWVCVTSGTPGTWKTFGTIGA